MPNYHDFWKSWCQNAFQARAGDAAPKVVRGRYTLNGPTLPRVHRRLQSFQATHLASHGSTALHSSRQAANVESRTSTRDSTASLNCSASLGGCSRRPLRAGAASAPSSETASAPAPGPELNVRVDSTVVGVPVASDLGSPSTCGPSRRAPEGLLRPHLAANEPHARLYSLNIKRLISNYRPASANNRLYSSCNAMARRIAW